MSKAIKLISLLVLGLNLSACAAVFQSNSQDAPDSLELSLFSAKQFAQGTEYERFRLVGDSLWAECGLVQRKQLAANAALPGDSIFPADPSLQVLERKRETLSSTQIHRLKAAVSSLETSADPKRPTPPPGALFSLNAKGVFEVDATLSGRNTKFASSVEAISSSQDARSAEARKLYEAVKGMVPALCGTRSFYGIGPSEV